MQVSGIHGIHPESHAESMPHRRKSKVEGAGFSDLRHPALDPPWLIAVWISVTVIPIIPLHVVVLPAVDDISSVVHHQVMSVGAIFVSVPVVIIMVVPVIDSDLDLLSFGFDHNEGWCRDYSGEEQ
jgi:hypothetical protein